MNNESFSLHSVKLSFAAYCWNKDSNRTITPQYFPSPAEVAVKALWHLPELYSYCQSPWRTRFITMFVMNGWGRVGIMAGSEIWVLPWQVMVEWKQGNWNFGGGRQQEKKHFCSWDCLCPENWEMWAPRRGLCWRQYTCEEEIRAVTQVITSQMACVLVLDSQGAAMENIRTPQKT